MLPRRTLLAAALALAALAAPAAASASSIVYIDHGNVWSARPDGSHKLRLTSGGHWHSPTQSDDGRVAAVQGTGPIRLLARNGRLLHTITTKPARSADGGTFAPRPVDLSLSPDGSKLAYSYVANSCPVASSCGTIQRSTFYTRTSVRTATPQSTWGNQFGVSDPEWVTGSRALVFGGSGSQVDFDDLGGGDYSFTNWLAPDADQGDGELSRDGRRLATTFFYGDDTVIAFFAVSGDVRQGPPPAVPEVACSTDADARLADPSWSPDGRSIALQSRRGIEVYRFTSFGPGACTTAGDGRVLARSGSEPDWGPATR
jgi:Tol biopolymer transport system component